MHITRCPTSEVISIAARDRVWEDRDRLGASDDGRQRCRRAAQHIDPWVSLTKHRPRGDRLNLDQGVGTLDMARIKHSRPRSTEGSQ